MHMQHTCNYNALEKELQSIFGYKHHYHYTVYYLYQRSGQESQERS